MKNALPFELKGVARSERDRILETRGRKKNGHVECVFFQARWKNHEKGIACKRRTCDKKRKGDEQRELNLFNMEGLLRQ